MTVLKGEGDIVFGPNFVRLMLHGMFNDLHYGYKGELEIYMFLSKSNANLCIWIQRL